MKNELESSVQKIDPKLPEVQKCFISKIIPFKQGWIVERIDGKRVYYDGQLCYGEKWLQKQIKLQEN